MARFLSFWPLYLYLATNAAGAWMFFEIVSDPARIYQFSRNLVHLLDSAAQARETFWTFIDLFR